MDGNAVLAALIARLRAFGRSGLESIAKDAAPLVQKALRERASAGTDPDGKPWPPKKKGDGAALTGAADAITVTPTGTVVQATLHGKYVFHNFGTRRDPQRQILPSGGDHIPPSVAEALERATRDALSRVVKGGG